MLRQSLLITCFILATAPIVAQPGSHRFEKIEGLSQSTGYSITKDRQGFLWIATADGLNRYDGVEMKVYKPGLGNEQGQMTGRVIRSELREDEQETIWFSTDVAVHSFNKKTERFAIHPLTDIDNKQANVFANPILIANDTVWLASASMGMFALNKKTNSNAHYPLTVKDASGNFTQLMYNGVYDGNDNFWFATNKGLLRFNIRSKQWNASMASNSFYSLSYFADTLFISEGKNILRVNLKNNTKEYIHSAPDFIHRVYSDENGNVWAGDESGNVFRKNCNSGEFKWIGNINYSTSIRTNYPVYSFYADKSGILWTGAYMLGLMKTVTEKQQFSVFSNAGFVNTFYQEEKGKVWLGTFQNGIVILDIETGTTTPFELPYTGPQLIYGKSVHVIKTDSKGNLWTGISGYLFVREKSSKNFKPIKIPAVSNALQNPQVWCLTEYGDGWVFGTTIGLYFINKDYVVKHISWMGNGRVTDVLSKDNNLWIAFESGGVMIVKDLDDAASARRVFTDLNIKSLRDDDKRIWICTTGGLIEWDLSSESHKIYTEKDGLSNSYTYSVLKNSNNLWISTNAGLFRAEINSMTFTNFTADDGLPDNQFNSGAAYKSPGGDFFFGTPNGIVWFDPHRVTPNRSVPQPVMTDISVNSEPADSLLSSSYIKTLQLPWSRNNISFRFRGIEYNNPAKVEYAYQLKGWDKDWIYSGTLNEARYNNLPPGDYYFNVKSANSSGTWVEEPYIVRIAVAPPFWRTWWFYTLVAIACVALVVIITRRIAFASLQKKLAELERQRELDKERQRISREMHDDIGAGLTQITLISEFAKNKTTNGLGRELEEIATTSRQLVSNMSEIIWSLNPDNRSLDQLLSYLREQLNRQLEYSGIDYGISFPDQEPGLVLSNGARRNILLVIREIVNNAIKHSKAGKISINCVLTGNLLEFAITDNGTGFDLNKAYSGNGLKNIRERISSLNGNITITSLPNEGSTFRFSIAMK